MKQLHIKIDEDLYDEIKNDVIKEDTSLQSYVVECIKAKKRKKPVDSKRCKFKFIDLFAGIGGTRLGFESVGGKCVFTSEWDKFCQYNYEKNFGVKPHGDIRSIEINDIPEYDILLGGFPCQPFSLAGVSKKNSLGRPTGFLDETQGTLFFEVARIIEGTRPKAFMLENVKNLVSHDKKRTFQVVKETLEGLDYEVFYKIIDASSFVPQHRERIFIVGFDKRYCGENIEFSFPEYKKGNVKLRDILEKEVEDKYTLSDKLWSYLQAYAEKHKAKGNGFGYGMADLDGITRTLSARYHKDGSEILIPQDGKNPRKLTPRECARLMGFPENFKIEVSNTQAYKQFGNSVVVPVIESIAKEMVKTLYGKNNEK